MSVATLATDQSEKDRALTLRNRARLDANKNLLYWYKELYREQFRDLPNVASLRILEIGSGVSPLKRFHDSVIASDVLPLDYLDYVLDCHQIDEFAAIPDSSLDVITLTNVLHHLKDPVEFLHKAAVKLKHGGQIIAAEPYFSTFSTLIFKYLHHEPVDLHVSRPVLSEIKGPLSSANVALPWLIFIKNPAWSRTLTDTYDFDPKQFRPFSFVSYMATGGISRRLLIPKVVYRILFKIDLALSRTFPRLFASFFTIRLRRK